MRLNHAATPLNYKGEPMRSPDGDITFRDLVFGAINAEVQGFSPSPDEKARIFDISQRLYRDDDDEIILTVEEAAFIKKYAGMGLSPLGYGRVCEWIENAEGS